MTDDNGLIYMRARYYSPELRRFVNADIIAGKISNAITLNRFAYANGNPVLYIDPWGNIGILGCLLALGGIALLLTGCAATDQSTWLEDPWVATGRYDSIESVVENNYDSIMDQLKNSKTELGYVVYERYDGGYYLSRPQGGINATPTSIIIDLDSIPSDAIPVAIIHTHPAHNDTLIYSEVDMWELEKNQIPSYVIDVDGCVYVLRPGAEDVLDYEKLEFEQTKAKMRDK